MIPQIPQFLLVVGLSRTDSFNRHRAAQLRYLCMSQSAQCSVFTLQKELETTTGHAPARSEYHHNLALRGLDLGHRYRSFRKQATATQGWGFIEDYSELYIHSSRNSMESLRL